MGINMQKITINHKRVDVEMPRLGAAIRSLAKAGVDVEVKFGEKKSNRSLAQNRLLWMWNKLIADHVLESTGEHYSDDEIHEYMKSQLLPSKVVEIEGKPVRCRKSTAKLNTRDMADYLNKLDMYCADSLHLVLPRPEDLYYEAIK